MVKKIIVEYTSKDLMDKLDVMHNDIQNIDKKVAVTNGKVKLHEKLLYAIGGTLMSIMGWLLYLTQIGGK